MLSTFRKNQQVLMLAIAIMTIVAFVWLYNRTNLTQVGTNDVASVYGRVVQKAEIDRLVRGYQLAIALGLTDFVRDLGGLGSNEETSLNDFILNLLLVRHQAPELGIRPSDEAVAAVIKGLPALQTDGVFDPAKYATFLQEQLAPRGYTERQMEEMVGDSIRVREIRRVVTSPVAVGEGQVREAARLYQPVWGQVLRFESSAFLKDAQVTTEEIATFYGKNKEGLRSRENRSLSYVVLELPAAQQKSTGKERTAALQKLADQAVTAGKTLREGLAKGADFSKAASQAGLQSKKAAAIERDGSVNGKDAGLPPALVASAFRLQKEGELSEVIQDGSSFYIVSVSGITPTHQMELAEVSGKIAALLKSEKAARASAEAAVKSLEQVRNAMGSGKSFAEAVKAAGVKVQPFANLTPSDQKAGREQQLLAAATLGLAQGELGPLQPAPWGSMAVYLEKRAPLTDAQWKEHREELSKTLLANEQQLLFVDWLRQVRAQAGIKLLGGRGGSR